MIFSWLKNQRRKQLLAKPFPAAWRECLVGNVRHYRHLKRRKRALVEQVVRVLLAEKDWVGGAGLEVTDEMKATVAGQAAVLGLGMEEPYYFDAVQTIILYRGRYAHPPQFPGRDGIIRRGVQLLGESWYRGPIILSWRDVLQSGRDAGDGHNVTLHEFAHYLDGLDGEVDGTPPLVGRKQAQTWYRVTEAEYLRLLGQARRNEATLLDHYGASNRAEFFAVATECFFERPQAMQRQHGELYGVLRTFYRQNPARWLPDAHVAGPGVQTAGPAPKTAAVQRYRRQRLDVLRSNNPTTLFTLAVEYFSEGRYALAAGVATRIIARNPDDGEAYQQRAMARVKLGRYATALADANEALDCDPDDWEAYRARGAARVGLGQYKRAVQDLDRVLAEDKHDAEARYYRGRAWMGMGQPRRAVADYARSLDRRPLVAEIYYHSGLAHQALGNADEAAVDLAKAFQLDPQVDRRQ